MSEPVWIGLLGAPGSGKNALLAECLVHDRWEEYNLKGVRNCGRTLETSLDQAVGPHGSYREDIWVAFETLSAEARLRKRGASCVSAGTLLESVAHAVVNLDTLVLGPPTTETQEEIIMRQAVLPVLQVLWFHNFRYRFIFYLPCPQVKPPRLSRFDYDYGKRIDQAQLAILEMNGLRPQVLKAETPADRAQEIYDTVQEHYASSPVSD